MNKKNTIVGAFILLVVIGFLGFSQYKGQPKSTTLEGQPKSTTTTLDTVFANNYTENESSLKKFTPPEVASRNTESECYTIIRGYVFDLTLWVSLHPGGRDRILSICGKDGTDKFTQKHGGKLKFETILSHFKVGKLG